MSASPKVQIGLLLFPQLLMLDLVGPWEVFSSVPGASTHLVWKTREPVQAAKGMCALPTTTFSECPPLDVLCIPGGPGVAALLDDTETLDFVRRQARQARYTTSVCTGSLLLGAAGLLQQRRAACHWLSLNMLRAFGAIPVDERVVVDGNLVTGGGVTAGIDFALQLAAVIWGPAVAQSVQLTRPLMPAARSLPPPGSWPPCAKVLRRCRRNANCWCSRQQIGWHVRPATLQEPPHHDH